MSPIDDIFMLDSFKFQMQKAHQDIVLKVKSVGMKSSIGNLDPSDLRGRVFSCHANYMQLIPTSAMTRLTRPACSTFSSKGRLHSG